MLFRSPPILAETMGVRIRGPRYRRLIPAGTPLPHRIVVDDLLALPASGRSIRVPLYRGDAAHVLDNQPLVTLEIQVPEEVAAPRHRGGARLALSLKVSRNKVLTAAAWLRDCPGVRARIQVKNPYRAQDPHREREDLPFVDDLEEAHSDEV